MNNKLNIDLGGVEKTLLLPLWGRAEELKKKKPKLVDKTAAEIIDKIDFDFSLIAQVIHPVTQHEWICRSIHIDRAIKTFLVKHPAGTIVNVGCGLDTTFNRVDNGTLNWFELDVQQVIELRKNFIPESSRRRYLPYSFYDESWIKEVDAKNGVLFMAAGVFYYLEEEKLKEVFKRIAEQFPGSEMIFDAASPLGVKAANERVIKGTDMDERSNLKWGLNKAEELLEWNCGIKTAVEFPIYRGLKKGLSFRNKIFAYMSDKYKIMYMVHLTF